jgi:Uma2 family endonuclease
MSVLNQIQLTEEQQRMLDQDEMVRFEATWEEFTDFLETTDYRIEYCNGDIIIMGLTKALHEWLVGRIIFLLSSFYEGKNYFVFGSNLGIHPAPKSKYHNADVTVV